MPALEENYRELIKSMVKTQKNFENQKYGEFIMQTNKIQFYLSNLILLRSSYPDDAYTGYLERIEFFPLIALFCACAEIKTGEVSLIPKLRKYQEKRNRLAHKMYTPQKLTKEECQQAINEGEEILKALNYIWDEEIKKRKKIKRSLDDFEK